MIYGNYYPVRSRCYSCNQMGHNAVQCAFIHFLPDKEKIIKKYNYYLDQARNPDIIRKPYKAKALKNVFKSRDAIKKIREMLQKEKEMLLGQDESIISTDPIITENDEDSESYEDEEEALIKKEKENLSKDKEEDNMTDHQITNFEMNKDAIKTVSLDSQTNKSAKEKDNCKFKSLEDIPYKINSTDFLQISSPKNGLNKQINSNKEISFESFLKKEFQEINKEKEKEKKIMENSLHITIITITLILIAILITP